jgi:hypothetical protein
MEYADVLAKYKRMRGVAAIMLALYAATTQQGWAWQDSGIFQWRILNFNLTGRLGLALAHPLLILLGKAMSWLPLGAPAFRINLLSALGGAVRPRGAVGGPPGCDDHRRRHGAVSAAADPARRGRGPERRDRGKPEASRASGRAKRVCRLAVAWVLSPVAG